MPVIGVPAPGLQAARLRKALTQRELAAAAGLAASTVARVEVGWPAAPSTLRKLAGVLGLEPADLLERRDRPRPRPAAPAGGRRRRRGAARR